jgi:hypothetical protein
MEAAYCCSVGEGGFGYGWLHTMCCGNITFVLLLLLLL